MTETLQTIALVLGIVSPIASAVYVVATVKAELRALKENVERHEIELRELRRVGAL